MPRTLQMRKLAIEERTALEQLARSRTAATRLVERAHVVLAAVEGERVSSIAARFHLSKNTVYLWLRRFNGSGLAGLEDESRSGRPRTYNSADMAKIFAAATTAPQTLGLPFTAWTLDRLATYLREYKGITMKRSQLNEILLAEGVSWRTKGKLVRGNRQSLLPREMS